MHTLPCRVNLSSSAPRRTSRLLVFIPLVLILPLQPTRAAETAGSPLVLKTTGSLVVVGGGKLPPLVAAKFLELAGGKKARLVVIPTASEIADKPQPSPSYLFWQSQGAASVELLHTRDRKRADDLNFIRPLESATGVWISGGNQSKLTEAYLGTAVLREMRKVLDRGGVIGGTSAGASVMSAVMVTGGTAKASLGSGFGFVPGIVIDQHFSNRNRQGRLLAALADHPDLVGLGIDESTAAIFQGTTLGILGEASASVCLTATQGLPDSVQKLRSGEQID